MVAGVPAAAAAVCLIFSGVFRAHSFIMQNTLLSAHSPQQPQRALVEELWPREGSPSRLPQETLS